MSDVAPDYVEPRVGWRVWTVVEDGGDTRLSSLVYQSVWPPHEPMVARCRRPFAALPWVRMSLHGPPNYDCWCGIHALASATLALPYLTAGVAGGATGLLRILGTVSLWGRVVEGAAGWRATYAYPQRLFVPVSARRRIVLSCAPGRPSLSTIIRGLGDYGVPIQLVRLSELPALPGDPPLQAA
jgi:hypothetical protein